MHELNFSELFANSLVGYLSASTIWKGDILVDYKIEYVNDAFANIYGTATGNLVGKKFSEISANSEYSKEWLDKIQNALELRNSQTFQQYAPQIKRWFNGQILSRSKENFIIQFWDVTDEKLNEESVNSLLRIFEDAVFELDDQLVFKKVSYASDSLLFFPKEHFIGKSLQELFHGELLDKFMETFETARSTNEVQIIQYAAPEIFPDKEFRARVLYRTIGGVENDFFVSIVDITAKKNAEKALQFRKEFEQLLVDCTTLIIQSDEASFDNKMNEVLAKIGLFSKVDRSYFFRFDYNAQTCSNTHEWCKDGVSPEKDNLQDVPIEAVPTWVANMLQGKEVYIDDLDALSEEWASEKEILEPQGIKSLLSLPVMESNRLYGFLGFDAVTEKVEWTQDSRNLLRILADNLGSVIKRNLQNEELRVKTEMATAASKAKSEFLANMSHEIRTPLNGVVGFAELLKGTSLDSVQMQYIKNLHESAVSLMDLINQILDFSKIEAGKMVLDLDKTDLRQVLENASTLVRHVTGMKGLNFRVQIDEKLPRFVITDAVRLRQVIVNILSNAVKFTPEGEVMLNAELISRNNGINKVKISVRDSGIGISEEQQKFLFKAFVQADTSTTKKYGGTGLGLVISNNLLGMMNSGLNLISTPGKGSNFYFEIDLQEENSERILEDMPMLKKHIAVVSFNDEFINDVKQVLEQKNIPLMVFKSLENLVASVIRNEVPDVIVVSDNGKDDLGLDFISKLRESALPQIADVPVVCYHRLEAAAIYDRCTRLKNVVPILEPVLPSELTIHLKQYEFKSEHVEKELPKESILEQAADPHRKAILIVEDNDVNLLLTKIIVSQLYPDIEIVEAINGQIAVQAAEARPFDLVLMDIQMPEMDGHEATRRIRKSKFANTPVIALTANAIAGEEEKCLEAGANGYITKPIDRDKLKDQLAKFLS
jgi:signal transduction histidine kinase/DNA-binding response OmpR family regulator/PAS domain-containing protein